MFEERGRNPALVRSVLAVAMAIALLTVTLPAPAGHASPGTLTVCDDTTACDFTTIQGAIDHAGPGDTILVGPGTYQQAPVIDVNAADEPLDGLTLCATTDGGTSCQPNPDEVVITSLAVAHTAVTVRAADVTVQGFTVRSPSGTATAVDASDAVRPRILDNVLEAGIDPEGPFASAAATLPDDVGATFTDPFTEEVVATGALHRVRAQARDEPGFLSAFPVTETEDGPHLGVAFTGSAPAGVEDRIASEHPVRVYEHVTPEPTMRVVPRDAIDEPAQGPQGPLVPSPVQDVGPGTFLLIDRPDIDPGFVAVCTANWVFEDPATGTQYLGTAGHCVLPEGIPNSETAAFDDAKDEITVEICEQPFWTTGVSVCFDIHPFATGHDVLYARQVQGGVEFGNDFAWIEIPDPYVLDVRPWLWQWGGPLGQVQPGFGDLAVHYGHGVGVGASFATEGRAAMALGSFPDGSFDALGWATGGDSGSPFATAEPRADALLFGNDAVGTITHSIVVVGAPLMTGTRVDRALDFLDATLGVELSLVLEDGSLLGAGGGGPSVPLPPVDPVERAGVALSGSTAALVQGNAITAFGGDGPGVGVWAKAAGGGAAGATIADNTIDAATVGVHLAAGSDGASVAGNDVTKTGQGAGAGIVVRGDDVLVSANALDASAGRATGIDVGGAAGATVSDNTVEVGLAADDPASTPVGSNADDRTAAYAADPFVQAMLGSDDLAGIAADRSDDPGFLAALPVPTPYPHVGLFYEDTAPPSVEEVPPGGPATAVRLYEHRGAPTPVLPDDPPARAPADGSAPTQGPQVPAPPAGIGPGSLVVGGICTANWAWRAQDPITGQDRFFLGTAGHCVMPDGAEGDGDDFVRTFDVCVSGCLFALAAVPGEEWVTLDPVYGISQGTGSDFAIAEVPPAHHDKIRPELWFWGGVDEEAQPAVGDVAVHYGWGLGTGDTFLTQGRAGVFSAQAFWGDGEVTFLGAASLGDSGSAIGRGVPDADRGIRGQAASGVLTHLCAGLATIPFNTCGTNVDRARQLVADFTGLDISVVTADGAGGGGSDGVARIGVDLADSTDATVAGNDIRVATASNAIGVHAAGDGATVRDNAIRMRGGGCTPEEIQAGACFLDDHTYGVLATGDGVLVETNVIAADLVDPDDGSIGGTNGVNAVGAADLTVRGNMLRYWAANAVALFGGTPNALVESNAFHTDGTGVLVCEGSDGTRVLKNGFQRHLEAVTVCGNPGPDGLVVNDNDLGLSNGVGLGLNANTAARVVDAECNDWGVYEPTAIRSTRIRDDGTANVVDIEPWTSATPDDPPLSCLVPPEAEFSFSPAEPSFDDEVQFTDESVEGSRPIVEWMWDFDDGETSSEQNPAHTFGVPGSFDVLLVVRDLEGLTSTVSHTVVTQDLPPVFDPPLADITVAEGEHVNFGVRAEDPEGGPVTLSASGLPDGASFHPDVPTADDGVAIGEFDWTPGFDQAGTHTVTFSASDGVNTASEAMVITVLNDDAVPDVVVLPPDHVSQKPDIVVVGESVRLQGRASVAEGSIVSAVFEKDGSGSTSLAATNVKDDLWKTAEVSYATTGEKTLVLTVEDNDGNVAFATRTIEVVDPQAPVAIMAEDPIVVDGVLPTVHVDGSPSFDPLGRPLTFSYAFSDGTVVSFGAAQVWKVPPTGWTPPGAGAHDVTLTVSNDLGLSDATTADILVDDALGVEASATPGEPGVGDAVNITGLVVDEAGDPKAGATLKVTVTHTPTGRSRAIFGSTAADGTFDLGLPYDVVLAGAAGSNLPGEHAVTVQATTLNAFDFEEEPGAHETGVTSFTYFVPAI